MKNLLICLLLVSLSAPSAWSVSSGTLVVTQTPDVSVVEGDTVNISCCWRGHYEQITVNWLKDPTQIKNESSILKRQSVKKEESNCSTLMLSNITTEDSGRYICKLSVEIPVHVSAEGDGTEITVMTRQKDNTGDNEDGGPRMSMLVHALRCLPFLLLLLTFFYFKCRWSRSQQHRAAAPGQTSNQGGKHHNEEKGDEEELEAERE